MVKPLKLQLICLLPSLVLKENIGLQMPNQLGFSLFLVRKKKALLYNLGSILQELRLLELIWPAKKGSCLSKNMLEQTTWPAPAWLLFEALILGYTALMGVPSKLQPNLFVSSTYSKQWVIQHSWVCHLDTNLFVSSRYLNKTLDYTELMGVPPKL